MAGTGVMLTFFLPEYCSEMNRIEEEWHQLKTHEIAGRARYDLALAVMDKYGSVAYKRWLHAGAFKFYSG